MLTAEACIRAITKHWSKGVVVAEDYSKKEEQLQQRLEKLKALERELKEKEKAVRAKEKSLKEKDKAKKQMVLRLSPDSLE